MTLLDEVVAVAVPEVQDVFDHPLLVHIPKAQQPEDLRLQRMVLDAFKPKTMLEIGVDQGYSTISFLTYPSSLQEYTGVDINAQPFVSKFQHPLFRFHHQCMFEFFRQNSQKFDLVHIDGEHHEVTFVNGYLDALPHLCHETSVVMIHDIYARAPSAEYCTVKGRTGEFADFFIADEITPEQVGAGVHRQLFNGLEGYFVGRVKCPI